MHVCMHVQMHVCNTNVYIDTQMCVCVHNTLMHVHAQRHTGTHTQYIHGCMYAYIHVHIRIPLWDRRALCRELCRLSLNTTECNTLSLTIALCRETHSQPSLGFLL